MAQQGINAGNMEYGRAPYAGTYVGNMEYFRCPGIGYKYFPCLTIQTSPDSGATITVSPNDVYGAGSGSTPFARYYETGTDVTLTAPATYNGKDFTTWQVDGSPVSGNPIIVTMGVDHTAVAYYETPTPPPEITKGVELLYTKLPRRRFWIADYPNLDPQAEGRLIPIGWGEPKKIKPTCIDTTLMKFQLMDNYGQAIKAIDAVRCGDETLVSGVDFTPDLANAQITIKGTPVLQANTTYYFVLESDYAINGTDYLRLSQKSSSFYSGGQRFDIDGAGAWTPVDADLFFIVYAKTSLTGQPSVLVDNWNVSWAGWNMAAALRDAAARTRLAQSFTTPASGGPWYLYSVKVDFRIPYGGPIGSPSSSRTTRITILSAYSPAEVQVGSKSYRLEDYQAPFLDTGYYPQRELSGDIQVDFKAIKNADESLMENVADILKDSYVTIMGGSEAALDAAALAALKAARTEGLTIWIDSEVQYREFLDKLELGQLFKFLPTLEWTFTTLFAESGEPSGTIHFRDEDFKAFTCRRFWSSIYQKVKVKYAEDYSTRIWGVCEAESEEAAYLYRVQRTLEVETYFRNSTNAQTYANTYRDLLGSPLRIIEFTTSGAKGAELIPWQKIKVTRTRADAPGGALNGILFRVLSVKKSPLSGDLVITALLDTQTYGA